MTLLVAVVVCLSVFSGRWKQLSTETSKRRENNPRPQKRSPPKKRRESEAQRRNGNPRCQCLFFSLSLFFFFATPIPSLCHLFLTFPLFPHLHSHSLHFIQHCPNLPSLTTIDTHTRAVILSLSPSPSHTLNASQSLDRGRGRWHAHASLNFGTGRD